MGYGQINEVPEEGLAPEDHHGDSRQVSVQFLCMDGSYIYSTVKLSYVLLCLGHFPPDISPPDFSPQRKMLITFLK